MIAFAADENLNSAILRGVKRRIPSLDVVTVRQAGLAGATDEAVLDWAAIEERVVVSHDAATFPGTARERLAAGKTLPGLIIIPMQLSIGRAVADLELLAAATTVDDWARNPILFLPL